MKTLKILSFMFMFSALVVSCGEAEKTADDAAATTTQVEDKVDAAADAATNAADKVEEVATDAANKVEEAATEAADKVEEAVDGHEGHDH